MWKVTQKRGVKVQLSFMVGKGDESIVRGCIVKNALHIGLKNGTNTEYMQK